MEIIPYIFLNSMAVDFLFEMLICIDVKCPVSFRYSNTSARSED